MVTYYNCNGAHKTNAYAQFSQFIITHNKQTNNPQTLGCEVSVLKLAPLTNYSPFKIEGYIESVDISHGLIQACLWYCFIKCCL